MTFLLLGLSLLLYVLECNWSARENGESRTYVIATQTLLSSGTLSYTTQDVEYAERLFGKFISRTRTKYAYSDKTILHKICTADAQQKDFLGRCHYWGSYSAFCIPIYWCCRTFHLFTENLYNAFKVTNIILMMLPLLYLCFYSGVSRVFRVTAFCAVLVSPAAQYLHWASAECFEYSFVTLSLLLMFDTRYYLSAFCLGLAASMNLTLFPASVALFAFFLADHWSLLTERKFGLLLGKSLLFGLCFFPVLHAVGTAYIQYGTLTTMSSSPLLMRMNPVQMPYYWQRVWAYFFDLNFGMIVYYNVLFLAALFLCPIAIWQRNWRYLILILACLGTVLSYSLMFHINCGMAGVHRYVVWSAPIAVMAVVWFVSMLSARLSFMLVGLYATVGLAICAFPLHAHYVFNSKVAAFVLDNIPRLYSPLYSIFICRENHLDGGICYAYTQPVVHIGKKETKVLMNQQDLKRFDEFFSVTEDWCPYVSKLVQKAIANGREYSYLHLPNGAYGVSAKEIYFNGNSRDKQRLKTIKGLYSPESWGAWYSGTVEITLVMPNDIEGGKVKVSLDMHACRVSVGVEVYCDNNRVTKWFVEPGKSQRYCFELTGVHPGGKVSVRLEQDTLVRPVDIWPESKDTRRLGVGISSMRVE